MNGVLKYTADMTLACISGTEASISTTGQKHAARDGFSSQALHAQFGPIFITENTLTVADIASLSVRLISSVSSLLKYHASIDKLFQVFSIHSGKLGYREMLGNDDIISTLQSVVTMYNIMLSDVRDIHNNPSLKPNGPHGSLPHIL